MQDFRFRRLLPVELPGISDSLSRHPGPNFHLRQMAKDFRIEAPEAEIARKVFIADFSTKFGRTCDQVGVSRSHGLMCSNGSQVQLAIPTDPKGEVPHADT